MIQRVLVANRGEIAVRILRAARLLGIQTVAVHSEADDGALHTRLADQSVLIGPAPANESYLDIGKLVDTAKRTGCDALHPGYGFLAERAAFAEAVIDAGLIWVGPPPSAIDLLGDKVRSRRLMETSGVPVTPGFDCDDQKAESFLKAAKKLGYPLLVKAAAGGGGKGMRVVRKEKELGESLEGAMREAKAAFGDSRVFLERYVERPRHIEFQIFADTHGNVVHLFERECSIQRRHQKVVEETPSTALTPDLRRRMGKAAVEAARAANYVNAGTVEFLFDSAQQEFYFLEVNTRIQVEHPITEEVVGVDLVSEQFRVASGEKLSWSQNDLVQRGHAIEARIYAEDPANGFLPAAGPLLYLEEPTGPGVRVDSGVVAGRDIPVHYDPILAKVITHGPDREAARRRMIQALEHYVALGVPTTAPFLHDVFAHEAFIAGETFTDFIPTYFNGWSGEEETLRDLAMGVSAALSGSAGQRLVESGNGTGIRSTPWQTTGAWRMGGAR
ncbi:MAG: acetyl-CoA carboxylase biotin carboxylase subunit [bacterium]